MFRGIALQVRARYSRHLVEGRLQLLDGLQQPRKVPQPVHHLRVQQLSYEGGESYPNWTVRLNPEGRINRKPEDQIYDRRTE